MNAAFAAGLALGYAVGASFACVVIYLGSRWYALDCQEPQP